MTPDKPKLYSTPEVAELLGREAITIRSLAKRKGIGTKIGPAYVFTEEDIEKLRQVDPRGGKYKADGTMERRAGFDKIKDRGPGKKKSPTPDAPDAR